MHAVFLAGMPPNLIMYVFIKTNIISRAWPSRTLGKVSSKVHDYLVFVFER